MDNEILQSCFDFMSEKIYKDPEDDNITVLDYQMSKYYYINDEFRRISHIINQ